MDVFRLQEILNDKNKTSIIYRTYSLTVRKVEVMTTSQTDKALQPTDKKLPFQPEKSVWNSRDAISVGSYCEAAFSNTVEKRLCGACTHVHWKASFQGQSRRYAPKSGSSLVGGCHTTRHRGECYRLSWNI